MATQIYIGRKEIPGRAILANFGMVEIVFPAAILKPPFFNVDADDAVNYGGIGAVIGHEYSHGFDDSGSQYDAQGNLRDWWTEADRAEFDARGDRLVAQYDAYAPFPDANVQGRLTLGVIAFLGLACLFFCLLAQLLAQCGLLETQLLERRFQR